jgi:hypothetical protein
MGVSGEKLEHLMAKSAAPKATAPKGDYYSSGRYDVGS